MKPEYDVDGPIPTDWSLVLPGQQDVAEQLRAATCGWTVKAAAVCHKCRVHLAETLVLYDVDDNELAIVVVVLRPFPLPELMVLEDGEGEMVAMTPQRLTFVQPGPSRMPGRITFAQWLIVNEPPLTTYPLKLTCTCRPDTATVTSRDLWFHPSTVLDPWSK